MYHRLNASLVAVARYTVSAIFLALMDFPALTEIKGCAKITHARVFGFRRQSYCISLSLTGQSQKDDVPDVLIQLTITQGLVMCRWCGLGLLAVLNTL